MQSARLEALQVAERGKAGKRGGVNARGAARVLAFPSPCTIAARQAKDTRTIPSRAKYVCDTRALHGARAPELSSRAALAIAAHLGGLNSASRGRGPNGLRSAYTAETGDLCMRFSSDVDAASRPQRQASAWLWNLDVIHGHSGAESKMREEERKTMEASFRRGSKWAKRSEAAAVQDARKTLIRVDISKERKGWGQRRESCRPGG
eukprot:2320223-Pleurochrysis_carterae.AAC.1